MTMNEIAESKGKELRSTVNSIGELNLQDEDHQKYLTFKVSDGIYGVGIDDVKEIIEYSTVTRVPLTAAFIRGVINLRGNVVPVVDLAIRIDKQSQEVSKRTCIIVVELEANGEKSDVGFVVDTVNAVLDIPEENIEPSPQFGADIRSDFIGGMGKVNEGFVVLLELARVLSIDELSQLTENMEI